VHGMAERLLALLLDGSPVLFIVGLLGLLALDVRRHVVVPVLRAYGRRWARRIETPPMSRDRPREPRGRPRRGSTRARPKPGPGAPP
jgi:hypothetical protein